VAARWTRVSEDRYEREDGVAVVRKPISGNWAPVAVGAARPVAGVRGRRTAEEAMAQVDAEQPLGGGPASDARDATPSERAWLAQARREARLPERAGPASSTLRRWSEEVRAQSALAPLTPRAQELEDELGRLSPSQFARALGEGAPSTRPPSTLPPHLERELQDELARAPRKTAPLPAPVAELPASRPARPITTPPPPTRPSPVARAPRPSEVPTRPWTPPSKLLREATPQRPSPARATETRTTSSDNPKEKYEAALDVCRGRLVREALERNPGNKSAAARELGITTAGLYKIMHRMGWESDPEIRAVRAASGNVGAQARWST
jgi:hypothetical protein